MNNNLFDKIWKENKWNGIESRSGKGSGLEQTKHIRSILSNILISYEIKTLLDIPCGDGFWQTESTIDVTLDKYIAADIVNGVVEAHKQRRMHQLAYSITPRNSCLFEFQVLDIRSSVLPDCDMIFCRDCLVHFSNADILLALENIKRCKHTYFMATTFTDHDNSEKDIVTGNGWRPINLQLSPFSLGNPVRIINEQCPLSAWKDKCLGIWQV
jgi:hypothetical protein